MVPINFFSLGYFYNRAFNIVIYPTRILSSDLVLDSFVSLFSISFAIFLIIWLISSFKGFKSSLLSSSNILFTKSKNYPHLLSCYWVNGKISKSNILIEETIVLCNYGSSLQLTIIYLSWRPDSNLIDQFSDWTISTLINPWRSSYWSKNERASLSCMKIYLFIKLKMISIIFLIDWNSLIMLLTFLLTSSSSPSELASSFACWFFFP